MRVNEPLDNNPGISTFASPAKNRGQSNAILGNFDFNRRTLSTGPSEILLYEKTQRLSLDGDWYALSVRLATLVATWYSTGHRSLLIWGTDPLRSPIGYGSDREQFLNELVARPKAALGRLNGAWGLVFADRASGRVIFACDRAARRPLCFCLGVDRVTFGLSARDVNHAIHGKPQFRSQAIFDYLRGHVIAAPETIFEDVSRLLPGQFVEIDDRRPSSSFYWEPTYECQFGAPRFRDASDRLMTLLTQSVSRDLGAGKTGAFLSGGTDSSTVAGILAKSTNAPANTYSIGFDAPGFDEMNFARIASRHFGTNHHEYYVTPDDLVHAIPDVATAFDQPFGNSSALPAYYCAQMAAADGVHRLLGGDGGDEIFGGNTRYAKQTIFEAYQAMPSALDRTVVERVLMSPRFTARLPVISKVRSYIAQARLRMPDRLHTYNLIERLGVCDVFSEEFLATVNPTEPVIFERAWYQRCQAPELVNRMLHYDWKYTLADNDIPKIITTCDLAGVEVAFPMLDEALVEFANLLPASWKVSRLRLRPFFKAALSSFLPREIIRKKKHGFGLPFGWWLTRHAPLRRLAFGCLESLKSRNIVRNTLIDELIDTRLATHAGYYGELIWILMMLQLWFDAPSSSMASSSYTDRPPLLVSTARH